MGHVEDGGRALKLPWASPSAGHGPRTVVVPAANIHGCAVWPRRQLASRRIYFDADQTFESHAVGATVDVSAMLRAPHQPGRNISAARLEHTTPRCIKDPKIASCWPRLHRFGRRTIVPECPAGFSLARTERGRRTTRQRVVSQIRYPNTDIHADKPSVLLDFQILFQQTGRNSGSKSPLSTRPCFRCCRASHAVWKLGSSPTKSVVNRHPSRPSVIPLGLS
jgi:hypothetical protein